MNLNNWREWFVPPEDDDPAHQIEEDIRLLAGSGHKGDDSLLKLKKKLPPRCASCKKFVGFHTGMHIMINQDWRIHIECFERVLERHFKDGEVIDLTTGIIHKVDRDTPDPADD